MMMMAMRYYYLGGVPLAQSASQYGVWQICFRGHVIDERFVPRCQDVKMSKMLLVRHVDLCACCVRVVQGTQHTQGVWQCGETAGRRRQSTAQAHVNVHSAHRRPAFWGSAGLCLCGALVG